MREEVEKLYQQGVPYRQIAKRLGISVGKVAGIIRRLGIAKKEDTCRCFNASKDRVKIIVFQPERDLSEPKTIVSPYSSPKQRAAYEELRKAVENTR